MMPVAIVAETFSEIKAPAKLANEASAIAARGEQRPSRDRAGDHVRGGVETVGEIERQRGGDSDHKQGIRMHRSEGFPLTPKTVY